MTQFSPAFAVILPHLKVLVIFKAILLCRMSMLKTSGQVVGIAHREKHPKKGFFD